MLDILELIKRTRLQLLIHSYIYYRLNDNAISDYQFDMFSRRLVELQTTHPKLSEEVEWFEAFKDWDGTTGFDLPINDPWVESTGIYILNLSREFKGYTDDIF